jgi:hydroxymethylpyrimidine pyrophosphatase-like HAD family hydrolase
MSSKQIKVQLFVSDIDGCIGEPYQPYDVTGIQELRQLIEASPEIRFALCSGRPYPYVEAVTQLLGLSTPVLFESGGGMFDPVKAAVAWNPLLTQEIEEELADIRRWLIRDILPGTCMMYDVGKRTQAGLVGPYKEEIDAAVPVIEEYVAANHPVFDVFHTHVSIDAVHQRITKVEGMRWLAETLDVELPEIAFIGDTNGDIGALEIVGRSFSPANGTDLVRSTVQEVTKGSVVRGVIEAYRTCVTQAKTTSDVIAPRT